MWRGQSLSSFRSSLSSWQWELISLEDCHWNLNLHPPGKFLDSNNLVSCFLEQCYLTLVLRAHCLECFPCCPAHAHLIQLMIMLTGSLTVKLIKGRCVWAELDCKNAGRCAPRTRIGKHGSKVYYRSFQKLTLPVSLVFGFCLKKTK